MKAFSQTFNLTILKTLNKHALKRPPSYCNYSIYQYLYLYISMQLGLCNDENLFSIYVKGDRRGLHKRLSVLLPLYNAYCESILFRGAEISSFEDKGHICRYLTSWIALPTKLKKYKIITFNF